MNTRPVSTFQSTFRPVGADNAGGSSLGSKTGLIGIYAILLIQLIVLGRSLSHQPSVEDGLQEAIQKKIVQRTDELKEDIAKSRADAAKDVLNLQGELKVGFESATKRTDDLFLQAKNESSNKLDAIEKLIALRQKEESEGFSALNKVLGRIEEKLKTSDKSLQEIADMKQALEKMKTDILVELAVLKDRLKSNATPSDETEQAPSRPTRQGEKGSQK